MAATESTEIIQHTDEERAAWWGKQSPIMQQTLTHLANALYKENLRKDIRSIDAIRNAIIDTGINTQNAKADSESIARYEAETKASREREAASEAFEALKAWKAFANAEGSFDEALRLTNIAFAKKWGLLGEEAAQ